MSFLDFLSPALTVGTQAAGSYEAAKADANQRNQENFLKSAMLLKQQHDADVENQLRGAQTGLAQARTRAIQNPAPKPISLRPVDLSVGGKKVAGSYDETSGDYSYGGQKITNPQLWVQPRDRSVGEELRAQKQQEAEDAAEAWWNSNSGGQVNAQASAAFKQVRAAHPDWRPQRIMLAVKQAVESNAQGANLNARTERTAGNGGVQLVQGPDGKIMIAPPKGAAAPAPASSPRPAAVAPSSAPKLPASVDQQMYQSNPAYKKWVDAKLGTGSPE